MHFDVDLKVRATSHVSTQTSISTISKLHSSSTIVLDFNLLQFGSHLIQLQFETTSSTIIINYAFENQVPAIENLHIDGEAYFYYLMRRALTEDANAGNKRLK